MFGMVIKLGREGGPGHTLAGFHSSLECFLIPGGAVAVPECGAGCEDVLNRAVVKVHQHWGRGGVW